MDIMTRKTLTMYEALHQKSHIDGLYLKRKHGGRRVISIEMCVRLEDNNLGLYVRGSNEMLLKDVKKVGIVKTENLMEKEDLMSLNDLKKTSKMSLKTNGSERECMDDTCYTRASISNYTKNKIGKTMKNPLCGMCGEMGETVQHIICKYKKITQGEYKRRHDAVAKLEIVRKS